MNIQPFLSTDDTLNYLNHLDYIDIKNYCQTQKQACDGIFSLLLNRRGYSTLFDVEKVLKDFYTTIVYYIQYHYPTLPDYVNKTAFYNHMIRKITPYVERLCDGLINYVLRDDDQWKNHHIGVPNALTIVPFTSVHAKILLIKR